MPGTATQGGGSNGGSAAGSGSDEVARLVKRYGNHDRAIATLLRERKRDRDKLRETKYGDAAGEVLELRRKVDELQRENDELSERVVPQGAIVLTGDDATEYNAFKALGAKAKDIKDGLAERDTLKGKVAEIDRDRVVDEAAQAIGYKPSVLRRVAKAEGLVFEVREIDVEKDGRTEKKKVPHVRIAGDDKAEWSPLDKYAEKHLVDFLPSLKTDAEHGSGSGSGTGRAQGAGGSQGGSQYPQQAPSGGKAPNGGDVVGKVLASKYRAPSQLNTDKK